MYRISELANEVGLSRTAVLYYESQKLIEGKRLKNGYRVYEDKDVQRIRLIQLLQAGGLTLKECKACLEAKIDRELLQNRLTRLDEEIDKKQQSRNLLSSMLGEGRLKSWHETADRLAPDLHFDWLIKQGFDEKEALRLKWLSKDMNEHEQYMTDFMEVFESLDRWGPGSDDDTLKAFSRLPSQPKKILEIGCGNGVATTVLAKQSEVVITAVDNEPSALQKLASKSEKYGMSSRITPVCMSMTDLDFKAGSFDLVWCETSAYIMGVKNALLKWKSLLKKDGLLVLSDLVWLVDNPSEEAEAFWNGEYPDIQTVKKRLSEIRDAGYDVLDCFIYSKNSFDNYYEPLRDRVKKLIRDKGESTALSDLKKELEIYDKHYGEYGYKMFILKV